MKYIVTEPFLVHYLPETSPLRPPTNVDPQKKLPPPLPKKKIKKKITFFYQRSRHFRQFGSLFFPLQINNWGVPQFFSLNIFHLVLP